MIIQMLLMGFKIEEVPAIMYERTTGESMHSGFIQPINYILLISLSTLKIIVRQKARDNQLKNEVKTRRKIL